MLVIRRRAGESVLLGPEIEVQVIDVSAGRVKLGITAPQEVLILRKEIRLTNEQNAAAALPVAVGRIAELADFLRRRDGVSVPPASPAQ